MGYRVEYDISGKRVFVNTDKEKRRKRLRQILCVLSVMVVLVHGIVDRWIWDFLFPGYNESTKVAAENMIAQIREGEPVGDAVTTFCKEIIRNGQ